MSDFPSFMMSSPSTLEKPQIDKGCTVEDAAEELGVSQSTIEALLNDEFLTKRANGTICSAEIHELLTANSLAEEEAHILIEDYLAGKLTGEKRDYAAWLMDAE